MASKRHGKVTRKAYQVIMSGMVVSNNIVQNTNFQRFYRYPITETEARKDAINDPNIKNNHVYGIRVLSIRKCTLGMDWETYTGHSQILD